VDAKFCAEICDKRLRGFCDNFLKPGGPLQIRFKFFRGPPQFGDETLIFCEGIELLLRDVAEEFNGIMTTGFP
jgi:hypothetical protein